jgi:hypothetical protein
MGAVRIYQCFPDVNLSQLNHDFGCRSQVKSSQKKKLNAEVKSSQGTKKPCQENTGIYKAFSN